MESKEQELAKALDEQLKVANQEELESFRPKDVSIMNRAERKSRLKYYKNMFNKHLKCKPSINIDEENPEKQQAAVMRLQRWATRYAILARKINELELKGDYTRGVE